MSLRERFFEYVKIDTASVEEAGCIPSSEGQWELARLLKRQLEELGAEEVELTENCFVFASLPATKGLERAKTVGLLAHLDTAPDCPGKGVKPVLHPRYDGGTIVLENGLTIDPRRYPELLRYIGDDIVTSDGTTLLGADDKAGIAIIMETVSELTTNADRPHGKIRIGFTPDEEVSVGGASILDVDGFGADYGITVDGDGVGELNFETFNGCTVKVEIEGNNIHPAEAKGKMIHACSLAMELDGLLPGDQRPQFTEGREGFYHLCEMKGDVETTSMEYILRDFDRDVLQARIDAVQAAAESLNRKYGQDRVKMSVFHEYSNPWEILKDRPALVEGCKEAFSVCGMEPVITPIRGGTDGSTLSEKGLPCPNLFLGGHNYHSCREYVSVQAMEKSKEVLLKMIEIFAKDRTE